MQAGALSTPARPSRLASPPETNLPARRQRRGAPPPVTASSCPPSVLGTPHLWQASRNWKLQGGRVKRGGRRHGERAGEVWHAGRSWQRGSGAAAWAQAARVPPHRSTCPATGHPTQQSNTERMNSLDVAALGAAPVARLDALAGLQAVVTAAHAAAAAVATTTSLLGRRREQIQHNGVSEGGCCRARLGLAHAQRVAAVQPIHPNAGQPHRPPGRRRWGQYPLALPCRTGCRPRATGSSGCCSRGTASRLQRA